MVVFLSRFIDPKNNKRDTHLRSGDYFETDKYLTFTYSATEATRSPWNR
jgi:polyisoprenoid-binding protein YceI